MSAKDTRQQDTKCKVVVQQCLEAKLTIGADELVQTGRGIVVYISFLEGATEDDVLRTAKSVLSIRLCETGEAGEGGSLVSVLDLPGNVLVVPQACLAGKRKGNCVQYHGLVSKEEGRALYYAFVTECRRLMSGSAKCVESGSIVACGTYGARQRLSIETNGPFTHIFEY